MAANDNVIGCATDLTFMEMLSGAIGVDATGHPYIRLKTTTNVAGSKFFGCANGGDTNIEAGLRGIFTLDSNGDWAIRTGTA
jgi:hypothetical protein